MKYIHAVVAISLSSTAGRIRPCLHATIIALTDFHLFFLTYCARVFTRQIGVVEQMCACLWHSSSPYTDPYADAIHASMFFSFLVALSFSLASFEFSLVLSGILVRQVWLCIFLFVNTGSLPFSRVACWSESACHKRSNPSLLVSRVCCYANQLVPAAVLSAVTDDSCNKRLAQLQMFSLISYRKHAVIFRHASAPIHKL